MRRQSIVCPCPLYMPRPTLCASTPQNASLPCDTSRWTRALIALPSLRLRMPLLSCSPVLRPRALPSPSSATFASVTPKNLRHSGAAVARVFPSSGPLGNRGPQAPAGVQASARRLRGIERGAAPALAAFRLFPETGTESRMLTSRLLDVRQGAPSRSTTWPRVISQSSRPRRI